MTPAASLVPLILGFGNVLLADDGAGVRVVERLRSQRECRGYTCVDGGTMSFTLLAHIEAAASLLVIDAANMERPAGTLALFEGVQMDEFLRTPRRRTVHEVGLTDLLDIARLLGCLPERRALLCLQPECIDWSTCLTAPVEKSLDAAAAMARTLLQKWQAA